MHVHSYVTKLQITFANQLNYMQPPSVLFLYAYRSNFEFPLYKCIYSCIVEGFLFYIKLSTVHVYQMTCFSSITEHRAINFDWVAVSPSLSLSFSRDQKLIEFFFLPGRMVIWKRSLVMHTHFLISLTRLVFWSTGSHPPTICIP